MTRAGDRRHMPQLNSRATLAGAWLVAGIAPAVVSLVLGQGPWTPYAWIADKYVSAAEAVWGTLGSWATAVWSLL